MRRALPLLLALAGCGRSDPPPHDVTDSRLFVEAVTDGQGGAYLVEMDGTVWHLKGATAERVTFVRPSPPSPAR